MPADPQKDNPFVILWGVCLDVRKIHVERYKSPSFFVTEFEERSILYPLESLIVYRPSIVARVRQQFRYFDRKIFINLEKHIYPDTATSRSRESSAA